MDSICEYRLYNQGLSPARFSSLHEAVYHFGGVQSQDFPGALWALAQRMKDSVTENQLLEDFNAGKILRTHALRPTWHFVSPKDIRWLVAFNAPLVKPIIEYYNKQLDLTEETFKRSNVILEKILRDNTFLTRAEIVKHLQKEGIKTIGMGYGHILITAELDGIVCSGPKKGAQHTYALLDERVPSSARFSYEESVVELAIRYFTSHGPALVKDFAWWSGLTITKAKEAVALAGKKLHHEKWGDKEYWYGSLSKERQADTEAWLLPNYDEYTIAYKDRSDFFTEEPIQIDKRNNVIFNHSILINGNIVGGWRRELKAKTVKVTQYLFRAVTAEEKKAIEAVTKKYGSFLEREISV